MIINQDLEKYLQPLDDYTYRQLLDSIRDRGQQVPITIGYLADEPDLLFLVDGHNRYKACKELGVEPIYSTPIEYNDLADVKLSMIDINDIRRRKLGGDERRRKLRALVEQDLLMPNGLNTREGCKNITANQLANQYGSTRQTIQNDLAVIRDEDYIKETLETNNVTCVITDTDIKAKAFAIKSLQSAETEDEFVKATMLARKYLTPHELRFAQIKFNNELSAKTAKQLAIAETRQKQLARINSAISDIEDRISKAGSDVRAELIETLQSRLVFTK